MPYEQITDFRLGLNASRFLLNLPEGSLVSGNNLHITPGAECEKRKAWVATARPAQTFGAEGSPNGIYTFGSRSVVWPILSIQRTLNYIALTYQAGVDGAEVAMGETIVVSGCADASLDITHTLTAADSVSGNILLIYNPGPDTADDTGTLALVLNSPLIFQQLLHPDGVTQMTGLVSSILFGSYAWVIALFADNNTFEYYDGILVPDFYDGLIWSGGRTGFDLAVNMSRQINGSGNYTASAPVLPTALTFEVTAGTAGTAAIAATGAYTQDVTRPPDVNSTITLASETYTFVTSLNNAVPNQVIRGSPSISLTNLFNAINGGAGSGTTYSSATSANALAAASNLNTGLGTFLATAVTAGTGGNALATSVSSSPSPHGNWTGASLSGGLAAVSGSGYVGSALYNFSAIQALTPFLGTTSVFILPPFPGTDFFSPAYTFVSVLNNDTLHPNQIQIGGSMAASLTNLFNAITGGGAPGTDYSLGTIPNQYAQAGTLNTGAGTFLATSVFIGVGGNAMISATNVTGASWSAANLSNGTSLVAAYGTFTMTVNATNGQTVTLGGIGFLTDLNTTAAALAQAINAATDGWYQVVPPASANPLRFVATASGNTVSVVPPVPVEASDYITVETGQNMQVVVPPTLFTFNVFSIPTPSSPTPYSLTPSQVSAAGVITDVLDNTGYPSVAPVPASGQFTIVAGTMNVQATGTLTDGSTVNPSPLARVTIGNTTYTFVNTFSSLANEILIQSTADKTLAALVAAINGAAGAGSLYSQGTVKNTQVTASPVAAHATTITSILGGTAGNAIASSSTDPVANTMTWGAVTLTGGTDVNQITQVEVGSTNLLSAYVAFTLSAAQLAIDVASAINAQSGLTGYTATAQNGVVSIYSTSQGTAANGSVVTVTAAGDICVYNCLFTVGALSAGNNISAIAVGLQALMTATITWNGTDTVPQFCAKVVANINAYTGTSGWLACQIGSGIFLSRAVTASTDSPATPLVTASAPVLSGTSSTNSLATGLNTTSCTLVGTQFVQSGRLTGSYTYKAVPSPSVNASGGVPPYAYKWSLVDTGNYKPRVICSNPILAAPKWSGRGGLGPGVELWQCAVTDSATNSISTPAVSFYFTV